jgi:ketosteroid isomerase-like protein
MTVEENRQTVLKFLKAQEERKGNIDESLVTADFQWWILGYGLHDMKSQMAIVEQIRPHLSKWYQFEVKNMIVDADQVAVEMFGTATMTTGKVYKNDFCLVFKLRNGRICSIREYYDTKVARDFYADILK